MFLRTSPTIQIRPESLLQYFYFPSITFSCNSQKLVLFTVKCLAKICFFTQQLLQSTVPLLNPNKYCLYVQEVCFKQFSPFDSKSDFCKLLNLKSYVYDTWRSISPHTLELLKTSVVVPIESLYEKTCLSRTKPLQHTVKKKAGNSKMIQIFSSNDPLLKAINSYGLLKKINLFICQVILKNNYTLFEIWLFREQQARTAGGYSVYSMCLTWCDYSIINYSYRGRTNQFLKQTCNLIIW